MVATPLAPSEKFSALDGLEIIFMPVIASATGVPTRAEINAGTDLTTEIEGWEGFEVDPQEIETPGLVRYSGSIPGRITITSGVLRLYADRGATDVRSVLPDGTVGYLGFMDNGDTPTDKIDVWPIQVNRLSKIRSTEAATLLSVKFTHPALPFENKTIPAAT